jgi:hypothetical protein
MPWGKKFVALELCAVRPGVKFAHPVKARATPERSAEEKARARQRLLDARRRLSEAYARLPNRPIWQAIEDSLLPAEEIR